METIENNEDKIFIIPTNGYKPIKITFDSEPIILDILPKDWNYNIGSLIWWYENI